MSITLHSPLDMHLHLRETEMLACVAPLAARDFAGAVVMPNLISPVDSMHKLTQYLRDIAEVCGKEVFTPYMTLFFKPYSFAELSEAKGEVIGLKLYPAGITTQSEAGVSNFSEIEQTLHHMQELEIPLLVHGETNGFVMDREREFIDIYQELAGNFPKLHIIMEHITTADAVEFLDRYDNVSATVTLHHLLITLDDVVGGLMQPHLFCKPIAKTPRDREALRSAVFSGHPKLMFGSDSAPHPRHRKECVGCAAGVFTTPVALSLLVQIFEEEGCLELLQEFVSDNARKRYKISPPEKQLTLIEKEWVVPELYGNVRPFYAGERLRYAVARREP